MPNIEFRGSSSAMGFGLFGGAGAEPPGSYTHPMGFAGSAYQPEGWATVDLELYGAGGGQAGNYNGGTKLIANDIPNNGNLEVYTPTTASSGKSSQATSYAGNGGNGGSTNGPTLYRGHPGGGASYASWTGGSMVAAGGGGTGGVPLTVEGEPIVINGEGGDGLVAGGFPVTFGGEFCVVPP